MLLFRAILTIENLGSTLNPSFDMMEVGFHLARQTLSTRYSKERVLRDLAIVGRDVESLVQTTPRMLKRFFREWSTDDFSFRVKSNDTAKLAVAVGGLSSSLLKCSLALILFGTGITFIFLDRGPIVGNVSLWGMLCLSASVLSLMRWIYLAKKRT